MGHQFSGMRGSPFLKIGTKQSDFQSSGNVSLTILLGSLVITEGPKDEAELLE